MGRASPEQIERERRACRETIARVDEALSGRDSSENKGGNATFITGTEPRIETRNERHRREIEEQDRRHELERKRERREREKRTQAAREPLLVSAYQRIGAIEDQLLEVARATAKLADGVNDELIELRTENTKLSAQVSRLEGEVAKLQNEARELKAARKKGGERSVIDLPSMRVTR